MNWYARMIYPYEEGSGGLGHYDLQLVGNYTFDGVKYTNPVFTYGNDNGTGFLGIFNRSLSVAVYKKFLPFKGYNYNGKTSSTTAQYNAFLDLIKASIDTSSKKAVTIKDASGNKVGTGYRYTITSSYKNYSKKSRNCFMAVGLWVNALGDSRFKDFAAKHSYTDYTAYQMVNNYPSLWNLIGTL